MSDNEVVVEPDGYVAIVRINRPAVHNALNGRTLRLLAETVHALGAGGDARAIVLTGTGEKSFCAGADLDELAGLDVDAAHEVLGAGQRALREIERSPVPVISAVNGVALGGGFELVLASAFPVLSTRASLGLPEATLGLIPGYGGTQRLPRIVGKAVAAHMMLTGLRMPAQRAYELGLTPIEPVEQAVLLKTAVELAGGIAEGGPRAQSAILRALELTAPSDSDLAFETSLAAIATAGAESTEGVAAFKKRRSPDFPDVRRAPR